MLVFNSSRKEKTYIIIFIICSILFSLFYLPYLLFLKGAGEYKSIEDIVTIQRDALKINNQKIIYGSSIRAVNYYYKKALMNRISPEIIALGSSRVMQFRQEMFSLRFVNLGGAMNSLDSGLKICKDIIKKKPKLVIIGIDFWWFNEHFQKPGFKELLAPKQYKAKSSDIDLVRNWLKEDKISYLDLFKGMLNFPVKAVGVAGLLNGDGFGPDGSYYYTSVLSGKKKHHDPRFSDTLSRIKKGERRFEFATRFSDIHFKQFIFILDELAKNDIKVVLFFPPLASVVNNKMVMMETKYSYIPKLKKALAGAGYTFYDFTDAKKLGSSDCEFIDGFHGGEVTYSRILNELARADQRVTQYVNLKYLSKKIKEFNGLAFINTRSGSANEMDFLGLGCKKSINLSRQEVN